MILWSGQDLHPKESTYAFKEFGVRELVVSIKNQGQDLPGNPVVKNPPTNAGDMGSIPGLGRFHILQGN